MKRGTLASSPKRLAELIHGRVQAMLKIDEGVPRPEFGAELFTQHDFRRAFKQQPQNLQRLPVEPDSAVRCLRSCLARGSNSKAPKRFGEADCAILS